MRKVDSLLAEYGESHLNKTNKLIHWVCVPLIFFSIVGMIWSIPSPFGGMHNGYLNWATLGLVLVLIYYITLSVPLAIGMSVFIGLLVFVCHSIALSDVSLLKLSIIIFVLAWLGQFYGHKIEGKKPSFFKAIQFLLIGPAWLMGFVFRKLKINF